METQVGIFRLVVEILLTIINDIERTIVVMVSTYPQWDDIDTNDFKTQTIARLNNAISNLERL
jgi:hypothetical protein